MKPKKKNGFLTFLCWFLPGAAEMYIGFIKNGLSIMVAFFGTIGVCSMIRMTLFDLCIPIVWFFGFFHAINYSKISAEKMSEMEDQWVWEEIFGVKSKQQINEKQMIGWIGCILFVVGCIMMWENVSGLLQSYIKLPASVIGIMQKTPRFMISGAAIGLGIRLSLGKKEALLDEEKK